MNGIKTVLYTHVALRTTKMAICRWLLVEGVFSQMAVGRPIGPSSGNMNQYGFYDNLGVFLAIIQ